MILLHVAVAALYVAGRVGAVAEAGLRCIRQRGGASDRTLRLSALARPPGARCCTGGCCAREFATPEGLDLSLPNALSLVAALVVLVAWASGLLRTLPAIGADRAAGRRRRVAAARVLRQSASLLVRRRAVGRGAHRDRARRLRALPGRSAAGAGADGAREASAPSAAGSRSRRRTSPPLLTLERFLFRLVAVGLRAAHADARERHAVFRGDLRQAGSRSRTRTCSRCSAG